MSLVKTLIRGYSLLETVTRCFRPFWGTFLQYEQSSTSVVAPHFERPFEGTLSALDHRSARRGERA